MESNFNKKIKCYLLENCKFDNKIIENPKILIENFLEKIPKIERISKKENYEEIFKFVVNSIIKIKNDGGWILNMNKEEINKIKNIRNNFLNVILKNIENFNIINNKED